MYYYVVRLPSRFYVIYASPKPTVYVSSRAKPETGAATRAANGESQNKTAFCNLDHHDANNKY